MREAGIRVGKVSSIDYETGMMRVTYKDKGESVTANCPYANFNNEYSMPKINESVVVAHLSNGSSRAVVLGTMWNKKNIPAEHGETVYRKELSKIGGTAIIRYEDEAGEYLVKAPNILIHGVNQTDVEGPEVNISANIGTRFESPLHEEYLQSVRVAGLEESDIEMEIVNNLKVLMELSDMEALIKKIKLETLEDIEAVIGTKLDVKVAEDLSVTAKKTVKLEAKSTVIKASDRVELGSGKEMIFEDSRFVSSFSEIMQRIEALDKDVSARK